MMQGGASNAGKIIVLGLSWGTTTEQLRDHFAPYGEIIDCMVMINRHTGQSRGFGFVTFADPAVVDRALAETHVIDGRQTDPKRAVPKDEMPGSGPGGAGVKSSRIFIAQIPEGVTEDEFKGHFAQYGMITDCYMPLDFTTKLPRGIGFITYESPASVDAVMGARHEFHGREVVVDRATPREDGKRGGAHSTGGLGYHQPMGFGGMMYQDPYGFGSPQGYPGGGFGGGGPGMHPGGTPEAPSAAKLFIGKLAYEASETDLLRYFSQFGRVLDVYIPKERGKSEHRGFGFVTFDSEAAATAVASRPGHAILGKPIAVDSAAPKGAAPSMGGSAAGAANGATAGLGSASSANAGASVAGPGYNFAQVGGFGQDPSMYGAPSSFDGFGGGLGYGGAFAQPQSSYKSQPPRGAALRPGFRPY